MNVFKLFIRKAYYLNLLRYNYKTILLSSLFKYYFNCCLNTLFSYELYLLKYMYMNINLFRIAPLPGQIYTEENGTHYIEGLRCSGTENNLFDCPMSVDNYGQCSSGNGVDCSRGITILSKLI